METLNLDSFFENLENAALVIDEEGEIQRSNRKAHDLGLTPGRSLVDDLLPNEVKSLRESLSDLKAQTIEQATLKVVGYPVLMSRSKWLIRHLPPYFTMYCREQKLITQEDFLLHSGLMKHVIDNTPNLITVKNALGQYIFANMAVYALADLHDHNLEMLNEQVNSGVLWLPGCGEQTLKVHELKRIQYLEFFTPPEHKQPMWFDNVCLSVKMDYGEMLTLTISVDITDWKMSQKYIVESERALMQSQKVSYMEEMAAQIAHEITNPLTIIMGQSHVIKRVLDDLGFDKDIVEVYTKHLQKIDTMVERIQKIIEMMRQLAHQGEKATGMAIDLKEITKSLKKSFADAFSESHIEFHMTSDTENHQVLCQPGDLMLVLSNIVQNAVEALNHNPKTGEPKSITCHIQEEEDWILVSLSNSGPKLGDDLVDRIFEPFFTTSPVTKKGLGLSLARKIIEKYDGTLSLDKNAECTTFLLHFKKP